MGRRQRAWARKAYEKLLLQLGGKCKKCGSLSALSIHHPQGRDWILSKREWSARISVYRREARDGLLEVLCASCNSKVGDPTKYVFTDDENQFQLFNHQSYSPGQAPDDDNCPF